MANGTAVVIGGVDTHKHVHHAATLSSTRELLGVAQFPTDLEGHMQLWAWLKGFGTVQTVGVEGTGFFGASLTRFLGAQGLEVLDVNRPNRSARRANGKSDRLDAEQAARAVLAKTATAIPKDKTGPVEAIRTLPLTRKSAVRAKNRTMNGLHATVICAPEPLRDELIALTKRTFVNRCLRLRPETENLIELGPMTWSVWISHPPSSAFGIWPGVGSTWTRRSSVSAAVSITALVEHTAPDLVSLFGVSSELAGQFLVTAGDNAERIKSEGAFAKICGAAPQPASSGKNQGRHRLSRSGDRTGQQRALHRRTGPHAPS